MWMDFVAPFSIYDVWQRSEKEIVFRVSKRKPDLGSFDAEVAAFRALVAPTLLPTWLGVPRREYTRFAFPDGVIVELAGVQPSLLALDYATVAVPTWAGLLGACYEVWLLVLRFRRRRSAV